MQRIRNPKQFNMKNITMYCGILQQQHAKLYEFKSEPTHGKLQTSTVKPSYTHKQTAACKQKQQNHETFN